MFGVLCGEVGRGYLVVCADVTGSADSRGLAREEAIASLSMIGNL